MHLALLLPLALLPFSLAKNTKVNVGSATGGLVFSHDSITADKGDTIEFVFYPKNHSVAESTFDKPCVAKDKGIFSGFTFNTTKDTAKQVFTVTVNDTDPIWLYCSQEGHCQGGMSMVINPPQDKTLKTYQDSSKEAVTSSQSEVAGGVISDQTSESASSSMSSMSSSAASATSAATGTSSTGTATGTAASTTPSGAVGKVNAGAGLGALGLLGVLVGGMV